MSYQGTFKHVLAALYDATLDDARWPAASALIDEACGIRGNGLVVGEGPKDDIQGLFIGFYQRGQRREGIEREYLEDYYPTDERVPRLSVTNPSSARKTGSVTRSAGAPAAGRSPPRRPAI